MSNQGTDIGREAASSLALSINELEDLFENAPCGYLSGDKDGRIGLANRTFANWTGFPSGSLVGRRFSELLTISGRIFYETHIAPMLHIQGKVDELALEIVCADGSKLSVLLNAVARNSDGDGRSFIRFTIFNATERRRYERDLLEARDTARAEAEAEHNSSELREQFIAVLGHDLRNPLASIASGLRLLGREALSDRGQQVVGLMDGSVVRATGLIDNVLDFARGRLGGGLALAKDASEPLQPTLVQVVAELRSIAPNRTVAEFYRLQEPIDCDRARIGQLLSNLLGNALTHGAEDQSVSVSAETGDGQLKIVVANGGVPIPAAAIERLFQPFFRGALTPARDGLGLGLFIASEIAKAHGGELAFVSDEVETRFTFTMPLT